MNKLIPYVTDVEEACRMMETEVGKKAMEAINPLLSRILVTINEIRGAIRAVSAVQNGTDEAREHWSVLYRAGDILDEQFTMLKNSTPVMIQNEVEFVKQCLVFLAKNVASAYGKRQSHFIITPKFQELAHLW